MMGIKAFEKGEAAENDFIAFMNGAAKRAEGVHDASTGSSPAGSPTKTPSSSTYSSSSCSPDRLSSEVPERHSASLEFSEVQQKLERAEAEAARCQEILSNIQQDISKMLTCPITHVPIRGPLLGLDGRTYEREAIRCWVVQRGGCPFTRKAMDLSMLRRSLLAEDLLALQERVWGGPALIQAGAPAKALRRQANPLAPVSIHRCFGNPPQA